MVNGATLTLKTAICILVVIKSVQSVDVNATSTRFPRKFRFGAASASYQIEGGWNADDKGVNIWDEFTHGNESRIRDRSNGDIACDSYHKYKEDVRLLADMGVDFYRFSLSWSRIMPTGFIDIVSRDGLNYYKNLIDELLSKGVEPFITIYHWDLPENLEKMGGWMNEKIVDYFADYARLVYREFGSKVRYFFTINEPSAFCLEGYASTEHAPGKNLPGIGEYLCMHNVLKAHARAYHIYENEFKDKYKGYISITIPCSGYFPKTPNDRSADDISFQFYCGWTAQPIFSATGDYPQIMKDRIAENSRIEGYPTSRLPKFTPEEIKYIRGTADFFSLNHYTSWMVENVPKKPNGTWYDDLGIKTSTDPKWPTGASSWLHVVPQGLRKTLNEIRNRYDNPVLLISENGYSDKGGLADVSRIRYMHDYMEAMLQAIYEDDCEIRGYTAWSVMDNFEWASGYTEKFGLVQVDFSSPNRTRTPKMSMRWYRDVIKGRKLIKYESNQNNYRVVPV